MELTLATFLWALANSFCAGLCLAGAALLFGSKTFRTIGVLLGALNIFLALRVVL